MSEKSKFAGLLAAAKGGEGEAVETEAQTLALPPRRTRTTPELTPAAPPKKIGRPAVGKRSNADYEQVSLYLRRDTHIAAKIRLLQDGDRRDLSEVMEELLAGWVKRK